MRKQFTFYESYWFAVKKLQKQRDRLSALEAICAYAIDGEEREMTDAADAVFTLIKPILDTAEKKSNGGKRSRKDNGKTTVRQRKDIGNEKEGDIEIEKESLDSFSIENESAALAPSRPDGGGAARRYGTYDPEAHKRPIVYKEFGNG